MRARYYSPNLMRFINEDIVTGDISNSNSLNRYSYVEGNPVTMVDPFGLEAMRARAQALEDKKVLDGVKFLGGLVLVCVPGLQGVGTGLLVSGATGLVVDILAQEKNLDPKTMAIIEEAAGVGEGVIAFFIPGGQAYGASQICSGLGGLGLGYASEGIYKAVTGEDSEAAFVIGDGIGNIVCGFAGDAAWKCYQKRTVEKITSSIDSGANPTSNIESLRQKAVREAWKQEKELVEKTGVGSREWTTEEIEELLQTGRVNGYEGQHMKSVSLFPEYASDPNNIRFLKGRLMDVNEHLDAHMGNYRNPTNWYYDPSSGVFVDFGDGNPW